MYPWSSTKPHYMRFAAQKFVVVSNDYFRQSLAKPSHKFILLMYLFLAIIYNFLFLTCKCKYVNTNLFLNNIS